MTPIDGQVLAEAIIELLRQALPLMPTREERGGHVKLGNGRCAACFKMINRLRVYCPKCAKSNGGQP
jgi:predicted amidophosphoribosyltransferase